MYLREKTRVAKRCSREFRIDTGPSTIQCMAMKRFTDAGRLAISSKNWYGALTTALIIPEICGSLEQPGPGRSRKRYVDWCKKWVEPEFTSLIGADQVKTVFLSAEDMYQARCSVIHSGSNEIPEPKRTSLDRLEFFSDGPHMNLILGGYYNGVEQPNFLQLRVDCFSTSIFDAADKWDDAMAFDPEVQAEKAKLLVIHSPGTIIGGTMFG